MDIKDLIIFLLVFLIVMWLQNNDDKKFSKKRESLYDTIKLPLFVAIIILVAKDISCCLFNNINTILFIEDIQPSTVDIFNKNNLDSPLNDIFLGPPNF
jgi:hypothetical protein